MLVGFWMAIDFIQATALEEIEQVRVQRHAGSGQPFCYVPFDAGKAWMAVLFR